MTVAEMPEHNHDVNDPGHAHETNGKHNISTGGGFIALSDDNLNGRRSVRSSVTNITILPRGGNQPHNNMQPSLVLNYIIKL
jgi:microcystin-dependent protein